jgi:hypothetical protein
LGALEHDVAFKFGQRRVLRQALGLLESATVPGAVADLGLSYRTAL